MSINDRQTARKNEYSYLIYIVSCLAIPLIIRAIPDRRQEEISIDGNILAFNLTLIFAFCSLAWVVGRRYELNYPLRCAIGGTALIMPNLIRATGVESFSNSIFVIIAFAVFAAFFIGIPLLLVSYPFQFLFRKLRSRKTAQNL